MEPNPDFYQFLASMGVGGILAGFTIWLLNKTQKENADTLKNLYELEKGRADILINVIKEVASNITANTIVTQSLHKRLDHDAVLSERRQV